ncbi:MAG: hypothetical protein ACW96U_08630 [Candidatus Heimdallarchaeaceae archaeon]|jgi:predicted transcriptional regulator
MIKSLKDSPIRIIEQKSALMILIKLLEVEKSTTNALFRTLGTGNSSFYTALKILKREKLVKSKGLERRRKELELTGVGREIAYKLIEIEEILDRAKKARGEYKKGGIYYEEE